VGRAKKQTIGYKYKLGIHMILAHGPIDNISQINIDKKRIWSGNNTGGQITINEPNIFGGDEKEGGIEGTLDIEMGGPSQLQNDYLQSKIETNIPAYRGVVGAVLRGLYLGTSPYIKPWSFRATRIHVKGTEGLEQWYDEKSEIGSTINSINQEFIDNFTGLQWLLPCGSSISPVICATSASASDVATMVGTTGAIYSASFRIRGVVELCNYTGGSDTNSSFAKKDPTGNTSFLVNQYKMIVSNPSATYVLNHGTFDFNSHALDYILTIPVAGGATITFEADTIDGQQAKNNSNVSVTDDDISKPIVVTQPYNGQFLQCDAKSISVHSDMNPAHMIRECLTDRDWGMGYLDSDVDETSFTGVADTLYNEGLGMSLLWDKQTTIENFVGEIVRHIDAAIYVSRSSGKFILRLIRDDYDPDDPDIIVFDASNIKKITNPNKPLISELINTVSVKYWDSEIGDEANITISDTAMVQQQGVPISKDLEYKGFTNQRNASYAGQRDLRSLSSPFFSCTIYTDQRARNLNIGDVVKLTLPRWKLNQTLMRVLGISSGNGRDNTVRLTVSEDIFRTPETILVSTTGTAWVDPSRLPDDIEYSLAGEIPYFELVMTYGQTTTDSTLNENPEFGYVFGVAAKSTAAINAILYTDDGTGFDFASNLDFAPFGLVDVEIDPIEETLFISDFIDIDTVVVGSHLQIGTGETLEHCRVDAVDTVTGEITIGRGCLDTTPHKHLVGETVFFWDTSYGSDSAEYVLSEVVGTKITAASGFGETPLVDAPQIDVTLDQRAYRPYPPGNFKINSVYYPTATQEGILTFTWSHRDRTQQTSTIIYDHTETDIGPEAGTDYVLYGYINDVLVHTEDPATSGDTWTPPSHGTIRVEVYSRRDGLLSMQPATHEFEYDTSSSRVTEDGNSRVTEEGNERFTED
jgi:hypothetical protein